MSYILNALNKQQKAAQGQDSTVVGFIGFQPKVVMAAVIVMVTAGVVAYFVGSSVAKRQEVTVAEVTVQTSSVVVHRDASVTEMAESAFFDEPPVVKPAALVQSQPEEEQKVIYLGDLAASNSQDKANQQSSQMSQEHHQETKPSDDLLAKFEAAVQETEQAPEQQEESVKDLLEQALKEIEMEDAGQATQPQEQHLEQASNQASSQGNTQPYQPEPNRHITNQSSDDAESAKYADVPPLSRASLVVQDNIPAMRFEMHIYASDGQGWVRVNGSDKVEGSILGNQLFLEKILPQKVILNYEGQLYSLPALSSW